MKQPKQLSIHDLTRRSTGLPEVSTEKEESFNSRPHKEVDVEGAKTSLGIDLSIHDLTRRSTKPLSRFI